MSGGTGIYAVHSKAPPMPDLKEIRAMRKKQSKRAVNERSVHSACTGAPLSGSAVYVYNATPEEIEKSANKRMQQYLYPSMTNEDMKAMVQKFSINLRPYGGKQKLTGTQFVRMVGDRLRQHLADYVRVNRATEYLNSVMDAIPSLNDAYSTDGTSAPAGGYRPPRESPYEMLVEYFLGWLRQLHGIADVVPSFDIDCKVAVVGLHNKMEICRELAAMKGKRIGKCGDFGDGLLPMAGGDAVVLGPDGTPLYIDHTKVMQDITSKVQVNEVYPSQKHSLSPVQITALTYLMNYNTPPSYDNVLSAMEDRFNSAREPRFKILENINNLNSLIHAFDLVDMDDSTEFLLAIQRTCTDKNITFNQELASDEVIMSKNKTNMLRFLQARVLLGMLHLNPSDFFNLYVTDMRQLDTVSSVLTAFGATNVWCLKTLESMLMLALSGDEYKPKILQNTQRKQVEPFRNASIFANACVRVHSGMYGQSPPHGVDTISVKKRFTLLALLQTYLDIEFDAAMINLWVPWEDANIFVWHALFFEKPYKYGLLIQRARSLVRTEYEVAKKGLAVVVDDDDDMLWKDFLVRMTPKHSALVLLPLLLLLDAYREYYKAMARGGDKNVFKFSRESVTCNAPMLTDPKLQIEYYHSYLTPTVSISAGDSFRTVTIRYLHSIFEPVRVVSPRAHPASQSTTTTTTDPQTRVDSTTGNRLEDAIHEKQTQIREIRKQLHSHRQQIASNMFGRAGAAAAREEERNLRHRLEDTARELRDMYRRHKNESSNTLDKEGLYVFHEKVYLYMLRLLRLMVERVCGGKTQVFSLKPAVIPMLLSQSGPVQVDSTENYKRPFPCTGPGLLLCDSST